jgi:hypothetical protein
MPARQSPGGDPGSEGIDVDDGDSTKRTSHDPARCATCRDGVIPWTPRRRTQFAIDALTHGRRICDLREAS